ncbi:PCNA-associated factor-like [Phymastichus coffea]|uniref:PCNA-associated factor-like n=1 Tax=Phymastichus coffea TaxID=108790 RepID=UPI00273C3C2B|nr:PCNA-associated factor-like [Phymastichus coffea]
MVRTKADGSTRVAAGGKAPKKTANKPVRIASPSANDKGGKDHLPGNRACPRETPAWQKKITFFYDKNAIPSKSTEDSDDESNSKNNFKPKTNTEADKSSTSIDDQDNCEMEIENCSILESSKVDESESIEIDE